MKSENRSFSTEPRTRRHIRNSISRNRAIAFMESLFQKGLKKCCYKTLEFEFVNFFGTNDKRIIDRYIGRPKQVIRSGGSTKIVRMNRLSGKIAQFQYFGERKISAIRGLMQILGYITILKDSTVLIHHDLMPYHTKQTSLHEPLPPRPSPLRSDERLEASKDDLRACSIEATESKRHHVINGDKERKKEEEVIDSAHTNLAWKEYASKHTRHTLTSLEEDILTVKPCISEMDKAKSGWPSDAKPSAVRRASRKTVRKEVVSHE